MSLLAVSLADIAATVADRWGFVLAGAVFGYTLHLLLSWRTVAEAQDVLDAADRAERERRNAFDDGWQAAMRTIGEEHAS